jgi:hypothetical protein
LLVRHLERADRLLDPYLAEPMTWHQEFSRVVQEAGGLAAASDGLAARSAGSGRYARQRC